MAKKQSKDIYKKGSINTDTSNMTDEDSALAEGMNQLMDSYVYNIKNRDYHGKPSFCGHGYYSFNFANGDADKILDEMYGKINAHVFNWTQGEFLVGVSITTNNTSSDAVFNISNNIYAAVI